MRIIITNVGEKERQDLIKTLPPSQSSSSSNILKTSIKAIPNWKNKSLSNEPSFNYSLSQKKEQSQIRLIKQINVNQVKIYPELIKDQLDKEFYDSMGKLKSSLLPKQNEEKTSPFIMPMPITKKHTMRPTHPHSDTQSKRFLIKDIINKSAYNEMIAKLNKELSRSKENYIMKHNNFRSTINQSIRDKSYDILNTPFKSSKGEFIDYVKNKKQLTPLFLKKLASVNEDQISELNKICIIMQTNQMNESMRKQKIKERKEAKRITIGVNLKKSLDTMKEHFSSQFLLFRSYNDHHIKRRKINNDYLEETLGYWKKYDVDKMQRRYRSKSTMNSHDDSLIDNELLKRLIDNNK